ncbi:MAG TPA: threonine synthase, partial [Blastocatellia bacterium]|nr:threonine synthase [Blastocatellia bacterium]
LETAHPVKFETVHEVLGTYGSVPSSIAALENREKVSIEMDADYDALRSVLLERVV